MGRMGQIFVAPGEEDESLPIPPSAWHSGRLVRLPLEHWELILDFAEKLDAEKTARLRRYSYPAEGRVLASDEELGDTLEFIDQLKQAIAAASPLVPKPNEIFLEDYPNDEHIRMLESVAAVLAESRRLRKPFEGDIDN